jgi:putative endonuclease
VSRTNAQQKGDDAEARAEVLLSQKGMRILARGARAGRGEIDLVAEDGDVVVFVEVRRRKTRIDAIESIGPRKQALLVRTASWWLAQHAPHARARFDVVVVVGTRAEHMVDAFRA